MASIPDAYWPWIAFGAALIFYTVRLLKYPK
jgi:hypothetical protein